MIGPVVEILAAVFLVAVFTVLILALAVGVVLSLTALRILRKVHRVAGWLRWPETKRPKSRDKV